MQILNFRLSRTHKRPLIFFFIVLYYFNLFTVLHYFILHANAEFQTKQNTLAIRHSMHFQIVSMPPVSYNRYIREQQRFHGN